MIKPVNTIQDAQGRCRIVLDALSDVAVFVELRKEKFSRPVGLFFATNLSIAQGAVMAINSALEVELYRVAA